MWQPQDESLLVLLEWLRVRDYRFVTPTPATHARVLERPERQRARSLTDVLGWSLPFEAATLDAEPLALLRQAGVVHAEGERLRATIRVSSLHERLFLHSAFPTDARDAVFFGPDSYRFADLIAAELEDSPPQPGAHVVDIGTGSGVGAIVAAAGCAKPVVTMTDINAQALRLARVNARAAGVEARAVLGRDLAGITGGIDIALANPPYLIDADRRAYRDGGGMHGAEVALAMADKATARLAAGGRLILYTGSAIVAGADPLCMALAELCRARGLTMRYREIDPDVFGEELDRPAYRDVDRIALVAAVITDRG